GEWPKGAHGWLPPNLRGGCFLQTQRCAAQQKLSHELSDRRWDVAQGFAGRLLRWRDLARHRTRARRLMQDPSTVASRTPSSTAPEPAGRWSIAIGGRSSRWCRGGRIPRIAGTADFAGRTDRYFADDDPPLEAMSSIDWGAALS